MAMTVNADAGISAPDTFRSEGIYAFRFDLNGDAREDVTFKVTFGEPSHATGGAHEHVQTFQVHRATGNDALHGIGGDLIASGTTGQVVQSASGVKAFAGLAPDIFAGDGVALISFTGAFFVKNLFQPQAFLNRKDIFEKRNITAIVLEVPTASIGSGLVHSWGTVSLYGHAPEIQVARWGLPLITHMYMPNMAIREQFNKSTPSDDATLFAPRFEDAATRMTQLAGTSAHPAEYGKQLAARFVPNVLPYQLGTAAAFDFVDFNGRALTDDVMDVMITLMTNSALADGVIPPADRVSEKFPYFGAPFTATDQAGLKPLNPGSKFKPAATS